MKRLIAVAVSAVLLAVATIGCGSEKEVEAPEAPKPPLIYASDPLAEAWVIEEPMTDQVETGIGMIRIRAATPDKNGVYAEGGAQVGLQLNLKVNDRVFTKLYDIYDKDDKYRTVRIASKDPRFVMTAAHGKPAIKDPEFIEDPDTDGKNEYVPLPAPEPPKDEQKPQ